MATMKLKVESSTATENGNFCNKLVNKSINVVSSPFGDVSQESQSTFYLFTTTENEVGVEGELDLSKYEIIEKPFDIKEDGEVKTLQLKYLYPIRI